MDVMAGWGGLTRPEPPPTRSPDSRPQTCGSAHESCGDHVASEHLEHLECNLQPSPPGCFTKKLVGRRLPAPPAAAARPWDAT